MKTTETAHLFEETELSYLSNICLFSECISEKYVPFQMSLRYFKNSYGTDYPFGRPTSHLICKYLQIKIET